MKKIIYILFVISLTSCASKKHTHGSEVIQSSNAQVTSTTSSCLSEGSMQRKSGSYVFVNQEAYNVEGTLNEVLNKILPKYEGKTVFVELNTTEYAVTSPIILPSKILSRVIIEGNNALIKSSVSAVEHVFIKPPDYAHGLTGLADTYQEVRNISIQGSGGAVKFVGGYQSKVINLLTRSMHSGVEMQFILQGKVEDCHLIQPRDFGIKLTTIPGQGKNKSQCNGAFIKDNRIVARDTEFGIYVSNSNLVKLDGNIIEGGKIDKGVWFYNDANTVLTFEMIRTHFENSEFTDACVYIEGFVDDFFIEKMYYHGKSGMAVNAACDKSLSYIHLNDCAWVGGWTFNSFKDQRGVTNRSTWNFNNTGDFTYIDRVKASFINFPSKVYFNKKRVN